MGGDPAHHITALGLEPVDDVQAVRGRPGLVGLVEAEAPDAHHRLAVLPGVGGGRGMGPHLVGPVLLHLALHIEPAGGVVHDVELPAVLLRRRADLGGHGVARRPLGAEGVEALEGGGVDGVLLHPAEVGVDGLLVVGGEQGGGPAVVEVAVVGPVALGVLAHIGPAMNARVVRRRRPGHIGGPVPPAVDRGAVPRAGEPALIADGDLADDVTGRAGRGGRGRRQPGGSQGTECRGAERGTDEMAA